MKTPEKEAMQVPEMAEQASSSKPKIFIAVSPDEENAASDGNTSNDGNAASDGSAAIAASSDVEFFEISDTSEEEITAEQLKKPERPHRETLLLCCHCWLWICSMGLFQTSS